MAASAHYQLHKHCVGSACAGCENWLHARRCYCCCHSTTALSPPRPLPNTGYTQLKPVSDQWDISVSATKSADKGAFVPVTCDSPQLSAPCNQPPLSADAHDKVRVQLKLKDKALKTIDNLDPKRVLVRACYTKPSAVDRPWRKADNVIDVSLLRGAGGSTMVMVALQVCLCCCVNQLSTSKQFSTR